MEKDIINTEKQKTHIVNISQQIIPVVNIPPIVAGKTLTQEEIKTLSFGDKILLKDVVSDKGSLTDLYFKLVKDKKGEFVGTFDFIDKKLKLEIPTVILGKEITKEQVEDLQKGKIVGPFGEKEKAVFVQLDKNKNEVVVKSAFEVKDLKEFGGYKLTDNDRQKFVNGEKLDTHVFKDPNGNYFLANIKLTEDKKGIEFTNLESISKERATELMPTLNPQINVVDSLVGAVAEAKLDNTNLAIDSVINTVGDVKTVDPRIERNEIIINSLKDKDIVFKQFLDKDRLVVIHKNEEGKHFLTEKHLSKDNQNNLYPIDNIKINEVAANKIIELSKMDLTNPENKDNAFGYIHKLNIGNEKGRDFQKEIIDAIDNKDVDKLMEINYGVKNKLEISTPNEKAEFKGKIENAVNHVDLTTTPLTVDEKGLIKSIIDESINLLKEPTKAIVQLEAKPLQLNNSITI